MHLFGYLYGRELVEFKAVVKSSSNRQLIKDIRTTLATMKEATECKDYYHGEKVNGVLYRLAQDMSVYNNEMAARGLKLPKK